MMYTIVLITSGQLFAQLLEKPLHQILSLDHEMP
jgi:hypothetical protein